MISDYFMTQILNNIKDQVCDVKIVLDGKEVDGEISGYTITDDHVLKLFVRAPKDPGQISDVRLYDEKQTLLVSKPKSVTRSEGYGLIIGFYFKLLGLEITDPAEIFVKGGIVNG